MPTSRTEPGQAEAPDWLAWSRRLRHEAPTPALAAGSDELLALDSAVDFAAEHARRYIRSGGTDDGWDGPRPICILYTLGRRSGRFRRNPVGYHDIDSARHIVASKGGAPTHPSWYLNILAEPLVQVRVGAEMYPARASVLTTAESLGIWPELISWQPILGEYRRTCTREIPVVRITARADE
jgi:deazaflavin-dependent oxidoreductase (nitroreductase family)